MTRFHLFLRGAALLALGLTPWKHESLHAQGHNTHRWLELYKDAEYQVSLDTAHIEPQPGDAYLVWYQTIHATLRDHEGKPWNREIVHSYLRCDPVSFKTVHITIFHDKGPAVAQQGGAPEDVAHQPWKEATASVDRAAMTRACEVVGARKRPG